VGRIENLREEDFEELQRFLEESYLCSRNHFPLSYPHVSTKERIDYESAYILRDKGRIASLVRIFSLVAVVGKQKIKVGGIGSVATHPDYRGKGCMKRLMDFCIGEIKRRNYAFSILGGDRQRYNFWRYETSGLEAIFTLTPRSIEKSGESKLISIKTFSGEEEILKKIITSHEKFPLRIERSKDDYRALLLERMHTNTWYIEEEGGFVYMTSVERGEDTFIIEIGGDENLWIPFVYTLLKRYALSGIKISYPYMGGGGFSTLYERAAGFNLQCLGMIKIISLRETLKGFKEELEEKWKEGNVFTFGVRETGKNVSLEKREGKILISEEEKGRKVSLREIELVRLIFGPFSPLISPEELKDIFPLRFYWWRLDHILEITLPNEGHQGA
jgi:predicted N-acetyltransferase YhbS